MTVEKDYKLVLVADDVDYSELGGVEPGGVRDYAEEQGAIWVEGQVPSDAEYPEGAIVFSYQPTLTGEEITTEVKTGRYDGAMVAAKKVSPLYEAVNKNEVDPKILLVDGRPFVDVAVRMGAGTNNVELVETAGGIVTNTPGRNSTATAEGAFSAINEVVAPQMHHQQHAKVMAGEANSEDLVSEYTGQMENKRYAVIAATGNIGGDIVQRLKPAIGPEGSIVGYSRSMDWKDAHNMHIELAESSLDAAKGADVFIIQTPLNDHTRGMITAEHFAAMNDGATYANTSRAELEDIVALEDAIRSGKIAGLVVDIDDLPQQGNDNPMKPYKEMLERLLEEGAIKDPRRFILKYHTLADTKGPAREDAGIQGVKQIIGVLRGEEPINQVPLGDGKSETPDHVGPVKLATVESAVVRNAIELKLAAETLLEIFNKADLGQKLDPENLQGLMYHANTIAKTLPTGRPLEK